MTLASAALAASLTGCGSSQRVATRRRTQGVAWPTQGNRPTPIGQTPVTPASAPPAHAGGFAIEPRSAWTPSAPRAGRTDPMDGVSRITVHHEGSTAVDFTDRAATVSRLQSILRTHTGDRGWGDIGYHYIIDRAGRVWSGRPADRQGAHVSRTNEHNLGIMCLGNFESQTPTQAQLDSLLAALRHFKQVCRVRDDQVFTHLELNATSCPGRQLQPRVESIRSRYL